MSADLDAAYAHCGTVLRELDRDRYLASLFAPAPQRRHLFALYAFSAETARVREAVTSPMPGEIRLQWWRDAIAGEARGDVASNPVAAAVTATIERFELPRQAFIDLIDARVFDLYDDPMPTLRDLEGYLGETSSALVRLASLVLANGRDPGFAAAAGHAGLAYGLTGLLRALPWHLAQKRLYLPADLLDRHGVPREAVLEGRSVPGLDPCIQALRGEAERHLTEARLLLAPLPRDLRPAFLTLALVSPRLAAIRPGRDALKPVDVELPLSLIWRMWRATRTGF